jgi:glycosyltransferase involved in cell wall biosynthesis
VGEIGEAEKGDFLGDACALLFPIDWPEPFGLVMIEAMACGTPVIARRCGSVPEVIQDGVNGYIAEGIEETVEAVKNVHRLSRATCRRVFEERFTVERMAQDYLALYKGLIHDKDQRPRRGKRYAYDGEHPAER